MKKLKVLVSLITDDNDYQLQQAAVAQHTAHHLDIAVEIIYAGNDGVNQSLQLLQAIQSSAESRPDAVVVEPVGTGMPQVAQAAAGAKIGWVVLNRSVDYVSRLRSPSSAPIFALATDGEEIGRLQGKQFNTLLPHRGCVLYVEGPANSDVARQRSSGMLSVKRDDIDVKTLRGDWTEASGYKAVKSWLRLTTSKDLSVGVIGCQNDAMALGARKAISELAGTGERESLLALPFTGCDGVPGKGQAYVDRHILKATVIAPPLTGIALEMLVQAIRSRVQPAEHTLVAPKSYPPLPEFRA